MLPPVAAMPLRLERTDARKDPLGRVMQNPGPFPVCDKFDVSPDMSLNKESDEHHNAAFRFWLFNSEYQCRASKAKRGLVGHGTTFLFFCADTRRVSGPRKSTLRNRER
jgi:hypothetical protein